MYKIIDQFERINTKYLKTSRNLMGLNLKDLVVREKTTLEAFSNKVIVPGKTTTDDVVWWHKPSD